MDSETLKRIKRRIADSLKNKLIKDYNEDDMFNLIDTILDIYHNLPEYDLYPTDIPESIDIEYLTNVELVALYKQTKAILIQNGKPLDCSEGLIKIEDELKLRDPERDWEL